MAVYKAEDAEKWFFSCKICKPAFISDRLPTKIQARAAEMLHNKRKH